MNPAVRKTTLANGVRILTHRMPHVRSVSMGVWVNVGARDESDAESGLSHLIEHMIFKGTESRSAFQIAKEFDAIGGQSNAFTTMENTCYHARVLDTHLETMVEILSDIFLNSRFEATELERERPVILQEIGMMEDSPDDYIHTLSGQNFWGDHPLGRPILGSRENISGFDAESIKQFFHKFYQPDQVILSAAGNLDHQHLVDLLGPKFEAIAEGKPPAARTAPEPHPRIQRHFRELEQVHVCLSANGISIKDRRRYACSLMNSILGGNMSSRLFQEIRERRGLAYAVYSFLTSHEDSGMLGVYVAVEPCHVTTTVELILRELRSFMADRVDRVELSGAKEFTKGNLLLAAENTDNQMVRLAQNEFHFGRHIPLNAIVEKIDAVTDEDIARLADDLFREKRVALTMLGPVEASDRLEHLLFLR